MIFIFFCYIFADIAFHVKGLSLSPFNEFHFVHLPCTNGTWQMYEIETAYLYNLYLFAPMHKG